MSTINLLPDDLKPMRGLRWRRALRIALPLTAVAWVVVAYVQIQNVEAKIADVETQKKQLGELVHERNQLNTQVIPIREPLSALAVTALLTQLMPEEVIVNELAIDIPPAAAPMAGAARKPGNRLTPPPGIVVTMVGRAPEGTAVTRYLIELQRSGVFEDVRIQDSKQVQLGDRMVQDFRLSMHIPLWTSDPVANPGGTP